MTKIRKTSSSYKAFELQRITFLFLGDAGNDSFDVNYVLGVSRSKARQHQLLKKVSHFEHTWAVLR